MANKMKLIIPFLLLLSSCNRPAPKVGEVWRGQGDSDALVISIEADQVRFKDLSTGDTLTAPTALFMGGAEKVGEVKKLKP